MKSVWMVEKGSYSDYSVIGPFSTKEKAERVAELLTDAYDTAMASEWTIDDFEFDKYPKGLVGFVVVLDSTGKVTVRREDVLRMDRIERKPEFYDLKDAGLWYREAEWEWRVGVWAQDEEHAKKIGLDKIAQARAEKEGIA